MNLDIQCPEGRRFGGLLPAFEEAREIDDTPRWIVKMPAGPKPWIGIAPGRTAPGGVRGGGREFCRRPKYGWSLEALQPDPLQNSFGFRGPPGGRGEAEREGPQLYQIETPIWCFYNSGDRRDLPQIERCPAPRRLSIFAGDSEIIFSPGPPGLNRVPLITEEQKGGVRRTAVRMLAVVPFALQRSG